MRNGKLAKLAQELRAKRADEFEGEAEEGFTLIELMVVLLIMAILLAIAIPTFLGVSNGAKDRAAQSNLTNAIISAKATYTNNGSSYAVTAAAEVTALQAAEPELTFTAGTVTNTTPNSVNVQVSSDGQVLLLTGESADGRCWYAEDNEEGTATADQGVTGVTTAANLSGKNGVYYNGTTLGSQATCGNALGVAGTTGTGTGAWNSKYPS